MADTYQLPTNLLRQARLALLDRIDLCKRMLDDPHDEHYWREALNDSREALAALDY